MLSYKEYKKLTPIAESIEDELKAIGYDNIKKMSNVRFAVLVDTNRVQALEDIAKKLGGTYDTTPSSASSVGMVKLPSGISVFAKPAKRQGNASAGVENEITLINGINTLCKTGPVNIEFKADARSFKCIGVTHCKEMGRDTSGRKKADVILETAGNISYPISIKKANAVVWESADTFAAEDAKKHLNACLKSGKVKIETDSKGISKITPNIAWKATQEQKKAVIFGSDILPNGCVIQATFTSNFYSIADDGTIVIPVNAIISKLSEATGEHDVWFLLRNDSTRKSPKLGYAGLRILACMTSRINSKVFKV